MMVGGLARTLSRNEQKRAQGCDRSQMDFVESVMQEQASCAKPRKTNKMAEVTSIIDAQFTQMRNELSLIHTLRLIHMQETVLSTHRVERLDSDFGLRVTEIETTVTNLETSTRQQIDLGATATERTTTHVNDEITEMNAKLDNVNLRLGDIEAQLADISPSVAQYRREGMQALHDLTVSTGGIRTINSITFLFSLNQPSSNFLKRNRLSIPNHSHFLSFSKY